MDIRDFLDANPVLSSKNTITMEQVAKVESIIGVHFGPQLVKYLVDYGYLAYEYVELYGVNPVQMLESDMVTQSKYLHKYFPKTANLVALENRGEGDYYLVDAEDNVFEYISELDKLESAKCKLFDYILKRFQNI